MSFSSLLEGLSLCSNYSEAHGKGGILHVHALHTLANMLFLRFVPATVGVLTMDIGSPAILPAFKTAARCRRSKKDGTDATTHERADNESPPVCRAMTSLQCRMR